MKSQADPKASSLRQTSLDHSSAGRITLVETTISEPLGSEAKEKASTSTDRQAILRLKSPATRIRKSKSKKSRSRSIPRKRVLRRDPTFRPIEETDLIGCVYVAYRAGAFKEEEGLTEQEFADRYVNDVLKWDEIYVLEALRPDGHVRPVGLMVVGISDHRMIPHVQWFPWASKRNKIETVLKFLNEMRKKWGVLVVADPDSVNFFNHICKTGILRRIGTSEVWYKGKRTPLYEVKQ